MFKTILFITLLFFTITSCLKNNSHIGSNNKKEIPSLTQGLNNKSQLIVDGKPFIMLGGELGNSTASCTECLKEHWDNFKKMNINTILAPVYWELIEKTESTFDFSTVDKLIKQARKNKIRLVLLWFGSWKNSMSCYVPGWVKADYQRFPRAKDKSGTAREILSPFYFNNLEADKKVFSALMNHLKETDGQENTVIMVQVENEIDMLPSARDYSDSANAVFQKPIPHNLIDYLNANQENLHSLLKEKWSDLSTEAKNGTWESVFGASPATDEIFMAWYFAQYANEIAKAGKKIYDLPMYVNAALNRPGKLPGEYPSAGPLPHLIDIWNAGAPSIDLISPDIYFGEFADWCKKYDVLNNTLFIPEIDNQRPNHVNALYAIGKHNALGFSPFSIEDLKADEGQGLLLSKSYEILRNIWPVLAQKQLESKSFALAFSNESRYDTLSFGETIFLAAHDFTLGWSPEIKSFEKWPETGVIVIQMADNEYIVAGTGVVIKFRNNTENEFITGISTIEKGAFDETGNWQSLILYNGDQSHQGRHLRIPYGSFEIQKIKLYHYK